jgi:hypothetical protein
MARETKYEAADFPPERENCRYLYFFRLDCNDGIQRPYFYDIEIDDEKFTHRTYHGKPGYSGGSHYMWANYKKQFDSSDKLDAAVATLVKRRRTFNNGPFTSTDASSRNGIADVANNSGSKKRPRGGDQGSSGGGGGGGHGLSASSSSSSAASMQKKRKASTMSGDAAASSSTLSVESVLRMNEAVLHAAFPFTSELQFDAQRLWTDKDHQTLSKPCQKAGRNLFGHSVIVGYNPKTRGKNFWVCGDKLGMIIPYNLKRKLAMTRKGRANHQSTDEEKARVAAMYRECELRGVGFKQPKRS